MASTTTRSAAHEQTPLLRHHRAQEDVATAQPPRGSRSSSDSATRTQQQQGDVPFPPYRILLPILFVIWVPVFAAALDSTIVAVLVSSIASSFGASERSSWLGTSYLLSVCCFAPIYGRLCDILGRRISMLLGLTFFTLGTLGCGLAGSMNALIAFRALAGAGGGGLTVVTSTVMSDVIPLRSRGLMQGLTNIIFGLGSGLGGPIGGLANDKLGWRAAFNLQVPILCLALLTSFLVDFDKHRHSVNMSLAPTAADADQLQQASPTLAFKLRQIDFLGSFFLVLSVGSTLFALSSLSAEDRTLKDMQVWLALVLGSLGSVAFIFVEHRIASKPILPLRLLTQRTAASVSLTNFALAISSFGLLYNYPLYFQAVKLQSASQAGLHQMPYSVSLSISSVLAGLYMRWRGVYWMYNLLNAALMVVGSGIIAAFTPSTPEWITWVAIAPLGFGTCGVLTCTLIALINSVSRSDIAVATGISYLFRTSGQVVGVAVSGAILQSVLANELKRCIRGPDSAQIIDAIRHQSSIIPTLEPEIREQAREAYMIALRSAFLFILGATVVVLLGSFAIEDVPLPEHSSKSTDSSQDEELGASQEQEQRRDDPGR
ncbi:Predicted transporter (major facilitator superfamily) [Ceraceosorus bombacis]|uniref:Predicted transporter (Major facilitator superfamily) n=1 Tax=Ceraceosorus bombacis TaxID=401625 RepID=A0A0P1BRF8_9BASI|nr:Predicted transporter (major facilitator superfamily) [Ceraceosorus bombacis]